MEHISLILFSFARSLILRSEVAKLLKDEQEKKDGERESFFSPVLLPVALHAALTYTKIAS
jgi:hypothetical protein